MKRIFVIGIFLSFLPLTGQKMAGVFGNRNALGIGMDASLFNLSAFSNGRVVIPTLQFTRIKSRERTLVYEYGVFDIDVKGNEDRYGDGEKLYMTMNHPDEGEGDFPIASTGNGIARGRTFAVYTQRNWLGMGPISPYHSWGLHVTSFSYKSDTYRYTYAANYGDRDTFFSNPKRPPKWAVAISFGIGARKMVGRSNRLFIDYGVRSRLQFWTNNRESGAFYEGNEFVVYKGVRSYIQSGYVTVRLGLHYALF